MKLSTRSRFRRITPYVIGFLLVVLLIDQWVWYSTKTAMYSDISLIPYRKVGLLLGTSKYLKGHRYNLFYQYRIEAVIRLYRAGKIDYIIVSGDNRQVEYNEPKMMQADLIKAGVPEECIVADYAGFRTFDSIVRCRDVFGEDKITIISQPFHNARALFIANRKKMDAIAFNAQDPYAPYWPKGYVRERLARIKMMIDLMFGTQPKFYGPRVTIG